MLKKIAFTAYPVKDMTRARAFYEGELGLKLSTKPHDVWIEYDPPGGCFALTTTLQPASNGGAIIAFEVENVDQLTETLRSHGVTIRAEPFSSPVCRMAVVADPEGNSVLLHQLTKKS